MRHSAAISKNKEVPPISPEDRLTYLFFARRNRRDKWHLFSQIKKLNRKEANLIRGQVEHEAHEKGYLKAEVRTNPDSVYDPSFVLRHRRDWDHCFEPSEYRPGCGYPTDEIGFFLRDLLYSAGACLQYVRPTQTSAPIDEKKDAGTDPPNGKPAALAEGATIENVPSHVDHVSSSPGSDETPTPSPPKAANTASSAPAATEVSEESRTPGPATSRPAEGKQDDIVDAQTASGSVRLLGADAGPIVNGASKPTLTPTQYNLIKLLINEGEKGLDKTGMEADVPSARRILKMLSADPDWQHVIRMPGTTGGHYRVI
ncbi:MAG: hypothetical protein JXA57_02295 [Armatimonadetes bacterium]|nr:hypothetical protein [Armatimonadota bacterium]